MKEIRNIIDVYESIDHAAEKIALAAVVNVEESSYRRIGARMLVRSNGQWIGGISGGCLEGDALRRSQTAIFKKKPSRVIYDTMEDDQNQIGVGLGCNGRIEVIFTPIDPDDAHNEIELLKGIVNLDHPSIMLKIIDSPDNKTLLAQKALIAQSDQIDFVGINSDLLRGNIEETIERRKPKIFKVQTENQENVKVLIEYIKPETHLIIVGDNYDVLAMLGIATELGWKCSVVGKAKKLSKRVYKLAKTVVDYDDARTLSVNDHTAVLLMSHDYNWDRMMIPIFVNQKPGYIGMLGPKKRLIKMQGEFDDIDLSKMDNFYSPTGLEIGAESPAEIALSMAAEIIATFRGKSGQSLHLKEGTIHDRD